MEEPLMICQLFSFFMRKSPYSKLKIIISSLWTKAKKNKFDVLIYISLFIIFLWILNLIILKGDTDGRGTFGDMFGGVNALFSGLALASIIYTILLQKEELGLQRKELKRTRKEFKQQNETLILQKFENTFFKLLELHHQIVNDIDFRYYKKKEISANRFEKAVIAPSDKEIVEIKGRDVFRYTYNKLFDELTNDEKTGFEIIYLKHYENNQTDLGHYFRNLYQILRFVDEFEFKDKTKARLRSRVDEYVYKENYKYARILRSQISNYELGWLFYNGLSEHGKDKFKPLIEKYSFFNNLPNNLIHDIIIQGLYSPEATNSPEESEWYHVEI